MKKILILTYYWPPAAGPGVQRFLKMSKYLPEFGWKPYIVTVNNGTYSSIDESLENDIPNEVEVYKTKTLEPFALYKLLVGKDQGAKSVGGIGLESKGNYLKYLSLYIRGNFFIPDSRKGWGRFAYKKALKLIKKEKIEYVISTGPPHSTHLIALKLKRKFKLKWVADIRDPWTNINYNMFFPRTEKTKRKDKKLEEKVSKTADMLSVVSKGLYEEFKEYNKNIHILYNGFDDEDIRLISNQPKNNHFVISYIGNFKPTQNVNLLWSVLSDLLIENKEFGKDLQISLVGNIAKSVLNSISEYSLEANLDVKGYVSHSEATNLMNMTDMLLFIIPNVKNNHVIITGKLFEYLAVKSPILPIGPIYGDASNIISSSGRAGMLDYEDYDGIKSRILQQYNKWKESNFLLKELGGSYKQYSRKSITQKLAFNLEKL